MTPEGRVKAEIKKYLDSIGAYHVWPVPTGYGSPLLDCYASIRGHFFAIEVKAPGKKPTSRQMQTILEINRKGGEALYVTKLDDLLDALHVV